VLLRIRLAVVLDLPNCRLAGTGCVDSDYDQSLLVTADYTLTLLDKETGI
jgi:hypothetical protein